MDRFQPISEDEVEAALFRMVALVDSTSMMDRKAPSRIVLSGDTWHPTAGRTQRPRLVDDSMTVDGLADEVAPEILEPIVSEERPLEIVREDPLMAELNAMMYRLLGNTDQADEAA